jgi:signal peptidase I
MYPTLTVNDQIAVEKFSKLIGSGPSRGDLVVFTPPQEYYVQKQQKQEKVF